MQRVAGDVLSSGIIVEGQDEFAGPRELTGKVSSAARGINSPARPLGLPIDLDGLELSTHWGTGGEISDSR